MIMGWWQLVAVYMAGAITGFMAGIILVFLVLGRVYGPKAGGAR